MVPNDPLLWYATPSTLSVTGLLACCTTTVCQMPSVRLGPSWNAIFPEPEVKLHRA
jgi:hypothetical protein